MKQQQPPPPPKVRVSDHRPKERTCLGCGKAFWSLGPGNRFCPKCAPLVAKKIAASSKQQLRTVRDTSPGALK